MNTGNSPKLPLSLDAWMLFRFEKHEIIRLDLKPGESIETHPNDQRIIFYVLEGNGTLTVESEQFSMEAHDSLAVEPNLVRGWLNHGQVDLKLLVIKTGGQNE